MDSRARSWTQVERAEKRCLPRQGKFTKEHDLQERFCRTVSVNPTQGPSSCELEMVMLPPGNKMVVRKIRGRRSSSLEELLVCWASLQLKAAGSAYCVWDAGRVTDTQYSLTHHLFLQGGIVESRRCFLWRRPPGSQLLPFPRMCCNSPLPPTPPPPTLPPAL